ncbi:hypothetical protein N1207_11035 [Bacillus subtilis]|uniref:hypothetical protein n=1 Tax=Bacillus TaxID=1386 RepID=UPI0009353A2E|nr:MULTISPECIES: hypothetical protein [Bacillus]MDR4182347.1 hypothetical protein [Bacillus subtilis]QXW83642.1 hypothetical protein KXZ66_10085 [Bacillus sp. LJBS17]URM16643.1 hypothetical protein JNE32_11195 [Bacillus subtilis]UWS55266.1 hypothetical protein N1207_11035 [Bacillus subtilis]WBU32455.1 hypothetical protein OSK17_10945 [Bacillus subtilis]
MSHSFSLVLSKKFPLRMLIKLCEIDFKMQLGKPVLGFSSGVQEDIGLFLTVSSRQIEFRFLRKGNFRVALKKVEDFIDKQFQGETVGVIYHDNVSRLRDIPKVDVIKLR